jgi:hypothetical protein
VREGGECTTSPSLRPRLSAGPSRIAAACLLRFGILYDSELSKAHKK